MAQWHAMRAAEVLSSVEADAQSGLDPADAEARLSRDGPNRVTVRRGKSAWRRFLDQLAQPLVLILVGAAAISAALGESVDAIVIGAVVIVNAAIGFLQEHRAEQAIAALDELVVTEATVVRGGTRQRIPSERLVVGDLVVLASGDAVPADLRLLSVRELQADEATLTGESVPVRKDPSSLPVDTSIGDRANMAFAGTAITYGTGRGVVVATGDRTETGRIAGLIAGAGEVTTPLTRRIAALSKLLLWIILGLAAAMFAVEAVRGTDLVYTFNATVALAVGAVPEGLPAAVTILLAVGVSSMARRRALIRKLPAVETLGSTTVICSDKTGTLTENEMTVTRLWTLEGGSDVTGVGYDPDGHFERAGQRIDPREDVALREALRVGLLCNETKVVRDRERVRIEGDPTEAALVVAAEKANLGDAAWRRIDEIPFESQHMYMATLHETPEGRVQLVKGSSDVLLPRCSGGLGRSGARVALDPDEVHRGVEELAREGLRVLCLARRAMPEGHDRLSHEDVADLTFAGLAGMIDPPRAAARHAVAACQRAGIRVKMITGDHGVTASAIAAQLGLEGERDADGSLRAMSGRELERLSPGELSELAEEVAVFARVAPEQKLLLVEALQGRGHIVAMTGDGVNDAPALQKADIGIAMGKGGTDVARGASAMILTDDDFSTIEAAVEEGRGVYDNLVKFVTWTLPTNGGEALVLLAAVVLGATLPILPVQILWVNMATALLLGIALVFEPKEPGLMDRPPRPVNAPILDRRLGVRTIIISALIAGSAFGLFRWALGAQGLSVEQARTIAVNTIVVVEAGYMFACRSLRLPLWRVGLFRNPWAWAGATVMLLAQLAFSYVPFMNTLFHTAPIDWIWWVYFTVAGAAVVASVELVKLIDRRRGSGAAPPRR